MLSSFGKPSSSQWYKTLLEKDFGCLTDVEVIVGSLYTEGCERAAVDGTSSSTSNASLILEEVLEEAPKWKVLREVLEEVEEERQKQGMLREEVWAEGEDTNNGIVLVACKDERIRNHQSISKREHDALVAAASKLKNPAENVHVVEDTPQAEFGEQGRAKRKRKVGTRNGPDVLDSSGVRNNAKEETSDEIRMSDSENKIVEDVTNPVSAASNGKPPPPMHFYALESDQPILGYIKALVVIVYHPDMTFVKEIEVYKAHNLSKDHKRLEVEKDRILKAGGFIQVGRVNGSLNLARAIGTRDYFVINSNGWMNTSFCNS
ncbi:hypothetical protein Fmac_008604 [Flemingia macrophylla]|uniref:PPM-type phosphatase domain-containing protein n=1 Tax=Flemingia macrophylla TaxID=520843 RepID=A0ABD1MXY9_9FABA